MKVFIFVLTIIFFLNGYAFAQSQRLHGVHFYNLGVPFGTPPEKIPLVNLQSFADKKDAIAAFVNGHWDGSKGVYNVILIKGGAQRLHNVYFGDLKIPYGTPPNKILLTKLQDFADSKRAIAAFVNGHWNGKTGIYNVILIKSGAQRIHNVRHYELDISVGTPPKRIPLVNLQNFADKKKAVAAFVNGHWNGKTGHYNVILLK